MDARAWDERYSQARQWSPGPNALAADLIRDLPVGTALDVAAGEGRMALWLAEQGWQVTALDFSAAGLARGRTAAPTGATVTWTVADATVAELGEGDYDLVMVLFLHLPRRSVADVLRRAAEAVAPGGHLLLLGHDRDNMADGVGGPQDPDLLWDVDLLRCAASGMDVQRCEQHRRPTEHGEAIDTLLWATRP